MKNLIHIPSIPKSYYSIQCPACYALYQFAQTDIQQLPYSGEWGIEHRSGIKCDRCDHDIEIPCNYMHKFGTMLKNFNDVNISGTTQCSCGRLFNYKSSDVKTYEVDIGGVCGSSHSNIQKFRSVACPSCNKSHSV